MTIDRKRGMIDQATITDMWIEDSGKYPTAAIATLTEQKRIRIRFGGDVDLVTSQMRSLLGLAPGDR